MKYNNMSYEEALAQLKDKLSEKYKFRNATEDELKSLNELADGRLTDEMLAYFSTFGMDYGERILQGNVAIYGAEHLLKFIRGGVPECTVFPFGFFCVASYITGDAICVDLEDEHHPVYHIPLELINDSDTIDFQIDGEERSFPVNRENILLVAFCVASNFALYVHNLNEITDPVPTSFTYLMKKAKEELELRELPGGIRFEIENGVLKKCRASKLVRDINIPDGVTAIGEEAFSYMYVRKVYIPDSVTEIGSNAFEFCTALDSIRLPENVTELPERMLFGCYSLKEITIPEGVKLLGHGCFDECISLDKISLPSSIKSVGEYCFDKCYELKGITIPYGAERIDYCGFAGCSGLRSVFIPNTVSFVEPGAMNGCEALTDFRWEGIVNAVELRMTDNPADLRSAFFMMTKKNFNVKFDVSLKYAFALGMYRETADSEAQEFIRKNFKKMAEFFIENDCEKNAVFLAEHTEITGKNRLKDLIKMAEKYNAQRIYDILSEMK